MSISADSSMPSSPLSSPDNPTPEKTTPPATGRRWLAAYVSMHHERKTRDRLLTMNIETFLPVRREVRQWSDRRKTVERILIPMILFVHVNPREESLVLTLSAVKRYMSLRGEHKPARIPDYQMEQFIFLTENAQEEVIMNDMPLTAGEKIRVTKGPLTGLEGELINYNGNSRIGVRIEQLGFATVEINRKWVEVLA